MLSWEVGMLWNITKRNKRWRDNEDETGDVLERGDAGSEEMNDNCDIVIRSPKSVTERIS